jgi:hypothetical protein
VLSVTIVRHSIHTAKAGQHHTHRQLGFCESASFRLTEDRDYRRFLRASFHAVIVPRIDQTSDETSGEGR